MSRDNETLQVAAQLFAPHFKPVPFRGRQFNAQLLSKEEWEHYKELNEDGKRHFREQWKDPNESMRLVARSCVDMASILVGEADRVDAEASLLDEKRREAVAFLLKDSDEWRLQRDGRWRCYSCGWIGDEKPKVSEAGHTSDCRSMLARRTLSKFAGIPPVEWTSESVQAALGLTLPERWKDPGGKGALAREICRHIAIAANTGSASMITSDPAAEVISHAAQLASRFGVSVRAENPHRLAFRLKS